MVGKDLIMATLFGSGGGSSGGGGTGGGVTIKTGTVTFAEITPTYTFVEGSPDVFVCWSINDGNPVHSSANYLWAFMKDKKTVTGQCFGYSVGTSKYSVPYTYTHYTTSYFEENMGAWEGYVSMNLGATTYKWIAIWGV